MTLPTGCVVLVVVVSFFALAARAGEHPADAQPVVTPTAVAQTTPVPHAGDAADDPAIWVHPTDPAQSLIIGTDKRGGLITYDVNGRQLAIVSPTARPNNVDVLYDVPLGGRREDLAVAGCRDPGSLGLKFWTINRQRRTLTDVTADGAVPVFDHTEPYGTCVYRSPKTGKHFVFVNDKKGAQEQYELHDAGAGKVGATRVRSFKLETETEGCVCDDERGLVYIAEERVGIWRFAAEPDGGDRGTLIARCGEHGLQGDVEGLTLYCAAGGKGYLIASSQGNSTFKVYHRDGGNEFVCTIDPVDGAFDDVDHTDGIAVTNRPLGPQFSAGVLVIQDGVHRGGNQNFKLFRWEDIARDRLLIDVKWDPRGTNPSGGSSRGN